MRAKALFSNIGRTAVRRRCGMIGVASTKTTIFH
jgi:hypothetical protein